MPRGGHCACFVLVGKFFLRSGAAFFARLGSRHPFPLSLEILQIIEFDADAAAFL
jgi:hypothetical protein